MFCQKCHVVGHICKEKKVSPKEQIPKQQCIQKDKGKEILIDTTTDTDGWSKPKIIVATTSIHVGKIQIPTGYEYEMLECPFITEEGGDLIPYQVICGSLRGMLEAATSLSSKKRSKSFYKLIKLMLHYS